MLVKVTLPPDNNNKIETIMYDAYAVSSVSSGRVSYGDGLLYSLPHGSTLRVMINGKWTILKDGE